MFNKRGVKLLSKFVADEILKLVLFLDFMYIYYKDPYVSQFPFTDK